MIWARLAIYGAAVAAIFLVGWHFGSGHVQAAWNVDRLAQDTVLQAQLAKNAAVANDYIKQVHDAEVARDATIQILADLRAQPHHGVLCHTTDDTHSVPALPTSTGASPTGAGALPPAARPDFDPTERLYALADESDSVVAECANALNLWPNSVPSAKGSIP